MNHQTTFIKCDVYGIEKEEGRRTLNHQSNQLLDGLPGLPSGREYPHFYYTLYNKVSNVLFRKGCRMMPAALLHVYNASIVSSFEGIVTSSGKIVTSSEGIVTSSWKIVTSFEGIVTPSVAIVTSGLPVVPIRKKPVTYNQYNIIFNSLIKSTYLLTKI